MPVATEMDMVNPVEVKRTSIISNVTHTMVIPMSKKQILAWESGDFLIQEVFPELSDEEREFILTGITPEEWDAIFDATDIDNEESN